METIENWILPMLKVVSVALTGILGVVALVVDFKNKEGKITKWGKRSLVGVIASALVAAATTGFEVLREKVQAQHTAEESLALSQKTNRIIQDINRSLHPLKDVQFAFWLEVSVDQAGLGGFKKRLDEKMQTWSKAPAKKRKSEEKELNVARIDLNGAKVVEVNGNSDLFPTEPQEAEAYYTVRYVDLMMQVYRKRVLPESFQKGTTEVGQYVRPDLEIDITTSGARDGDINVVYDPESSEMRVRVPWVRSDTRYWKSSGSILSVPDLEESQIFVFIRSTVNPPEGDEAGTVLKARGGLRLNRLIMKVGDGREFWFRQGEMKEYVTPDSLRYYALDAESALRGGL